MSFNFSWTNKKDGDDIYAEHVNSLADGIKETQEAVENISIDIDAEMSDTSTNAVQNKVVKTYIDESVGDVVETAENAQETANIAQANVQTVTVRL